MLAMARPRFRYEDTRTWEALLLALEDLQRIGAIQIIEGERPVVAHLCSALDRAGVFSLGERTGDR